ncbi:MAG: acyl carrier protein [Verrucomicrobiota bacterium]
MITEKVKKILTALLRLEPKEIELESELGADLGADSLELTEFVMALEEEFNIDIPDEDAEDIVTVGDVVTYLEGLVD